MKILKRGFTIVELLLVVVIITIIAAITIAYYIGITQRAGETMISTLAQEAKKELEMKKVIDEKYPSSLNDIKTNSSADYQYTVATDGQSFCMTIIHKSVPNTTHFIEQSSAPKKGACEGHRTTLTGSPGGGQMSVSLAQSAAQCCGNGQQTVSFNSTPTEGNLLVAIAGWRTNGSATATLSGSGWRSVYSAFYDRYNDDHEMGVFWKIAGTDEPKTINISTSTASTSNNLMVHEFSVSNATIGTPVSSHNSDLWNAYGTTGTVSTSSSNSLALGMSLNYRGAHRLANGSNEITWSDDLQYAHCSDSSDDISLHSAWRHHTTPASYSATATWGDTSGYATTDYATVGLVIFPLTPQ